MRLLERCADDTRLVGVRHVVAERDREDGRSQHPECRRRGAAAAGHRAPHHHEGRQPDHEKRVGVLVVALGRAGAAQRGVGQVVAAGGQDLDAAQRREVGQNRHERPGQTRDQKRHPERFQPRESPADRRLPAATILSRFRQCTAGTPSHEDRDPIDL